MKTRAFMHKIFLHKNYKKVINLVDGIEEISVTSESMEKQPSFKFKNKKKIDKDYMSDSISNDTSSEFDSYGLRKKKNDAKSLGYFEAEEILKKKTRNGKTYYKVKWKDYPVHQATWEAISNFTPNSLELVREFEKRNKSRKCKEVLSNLKANAGIIENPSITESPNIHSKVIKTSNITKPNGNLSSAEYKNKSSKHSIVSNSELRQRFSKRLKEKITIDNEIREIRLTSTELSSSEGINKSQYNEDSSYDECYSNPSEELSELSSYTSSSSSCVLTNKTKNISQESPISTSKLSTYSRSGVNTQEGKFLGKKTNNPKNKYSPNNNQKCDSFTYMDFPVGNIKYDAVKKILSAKLMDPKNVELSCLVEFKERPNGIAPEPKRYSSKIIRKYAPQSLIDFYQTRISVNRK